MLSHFVCLILAILTLPFIVPPSSEPDDVINIDMSSSLRKWYDNGHIINIYQQKIFYIHFKSLLPSNKTFLLVHGFPTSSYDFHRVIDTLLRHGDVIAHDHVGFGFSSKPQNFTYSLSELAEHTMELWRRLNVTSSKRDIHVIAHDMGDSVVCEMLARLSRDQLPDIYRDFFKSITFTNGGMIISKANLRIGQILLSNPIFGSYFTLLSNRLRVAKRFTRRQLASIFSPQCDASLVDDVIDDIMTTNRVNNGDLMFHKLIYYLSDRRNFEFRWFPALANPSIKMRLLWGDSDAVAPLEIATGIQSLSSGQIELTVLKGVGHFGMLEQPELWTEEVLKIL